MEKFKVENVEFDYVLYNNYISSIRRVYVYMR